MPVALLNNASTPPDYADSSTVVFSPPRGGFALHVFNAAIYYRVGVNNPAETAVNWEPGEHYLAQSLTSFRDPTLEGFPAGARYAGVMVRSANPDTPARVTVA